MLVAYIPNSIRLFREIRPALKLVPLEYGLVDLVSLLSRAKRSDHGNTRELSPFRRGRYRTRILIRTRKTEQT